MHMTVKPLNNRLNYYKRLKIYHRILHFSTQLNQTNRHRKMKAKNLKNS